MAVRAVWDPDIAHLADDPEFKRKVEAAYARSHGWSFRVHARDLGWISFEPDGDQVYHVYREKNQAA